MRKGTITDPTVEPIKRARAREFRSDPTRAEALAWEIVRDRRLLGLKYRRQVVIDGYIVDLLCAALGVVIEIDGAVHDTPEAREYDQRRREVIAARGWRELRITNGELTPERLKSILSSVLPLSGRSRATGGSNGEGAGG